MNEFIKYPSLERIGVTEVDGILDGRCYVFPKIDGTNASAWYCNDNGVQAGSRRRHLSLDEDNAGFYAAIKNCDKVNSFLKAHPDKRLYGEWLVPHSLKSYHDDAWRVFYVFDVLHNEKFMPYEEYQPLLEEHGLEYIPPIFIVERPREERLYNALEQNTFLIKDGEGIGEGVVVKNYDFVNRFGRTTWAKLVTSEFKAKHTKSLGPREVKEKARIEDKIAIDFVTTALVDKTQAKIVNEVGEWSSKFIPRLLNTVFYDVVREDAWQIVKQYKNPTINFSDLMKSVFAQVKNLRPELF